MNSLPLPVTILRCSVSIHMVFLETCCMIGNQLCFLMRLWPTRSFNSFAFFSFSFPCHFIHSYVANPLQCFTAGFLRKPCKETHSKVAMTSLHGGQKTESGQLQSVHMIFQTCAAGKQSCNLTQSLRGRGSERS